MQQRVCHSHVKYLMLFDCFTDAASETPNTMCHFLKSGLNVNSLKTCGTRAVKVSHENESKNSICIEPPLAQILLLFSPSLQLFTQMHLHLF